MVEIGGHYGCLINCITLIIIGVKEKVKQIGITVQESDDCHYCKKNELSNPF